MSQVLEQTCRQRTNFVNSLEIPALLTFLRLSLGLCRIHPSPSGNAITRELHSLHLFAAV